MWNYIRSSVIWLHEAEHVARFQQYFGILPKTNRQPDIIPSFNGNNFNNNNNNNNNLFIPFWYLNVLDMQYLC